MIGYLGKGKYKSRINGVRTPSYTAWRNMLLRCYGKNKSRRYKDCSVHEEWLNFQNFSEWFYKGYKEGYSLDKDILVKGNRIYSKDTCVLVPPRINSLLVKGEGLRGKMPLGVTYVKRVNKFVAKYQNRGKILFLGYFSTKEEAFNIYKSHKEAYIKEIAEEYKDSISLECYKALINHKIEIND